MPIASPPRWQIHTYTPSLLESRYNETGAHTIDTDLTGAYTTTLKPESCIRIEPACEISRKRGLFNLSVTGHAIMQNRAE